MPHPSDSLLARLNLDDLAANSADTLREAIAEVRRALTAPGHRVMLAVNERALAARINEILPPATDIPSILRAEHAKGYYQGRAEAFRAIAVWLEEAQATLQQKLTAEDQDDDF